MKDYLLPIFLFLLAGGILVVHFVHEGDKKTVLAESTTIPTSMASITPKPTEIPTATPSATPTVSPSPKPTPTRTPTPLPQPSFSSQEIYELINRFAGQYGVSPDVMRYIAICESGFNPLASHAGYAGLFQFGATTWKNLRTEIGEEINPDLRYNAEEAVQTAAYAISKGKEKMWPNCYP